VFGSEVTLFERESFHLMCGCQHKQLTDQLGFGDPKKIFGLQKYYLPLNLNATAIFTTVKNIISLLLNGSEKKHWRFRQITCHEKVVGSDRDLMKFFCIFFVGSWVFISSIVFLLANVIVVAIDLPFSISPSRVSVCKVILESGSHRVHNSLSESDDLFERAI